MVVIAVSRPGRNLPLISVVVLVRAKPATSRRPHQRLLISSSFVSVFSGLFLWPQEVDGGFFAARGMRWLAGLLSVRRVSTGTHQMCVAK